MQIKIALSPCPNDTFLFYAWIHGIVALPPIAHFADIDELNLLATEHAFPLIKVSIGHLPTLLDRYELLDVGVACGENHGPKLISREPFGLERLCEKRVAIPGLNTTAHLLLKLFFPEVQNKVVCRYDAMTTLLRQGIVDAALIIHETRFTFSKEGFYEIADLGEHWKREFNLPLPLGGIVIDKRALDKEAMTEILRASLHFARKNPEKTLQFVLEKSQEKDPEVVQKHIDLYVTKETERLSREGKEAIQRLINY